MSGKTCAGGGSVLRLPSARIAIAILAAIVFLTIFGSALAPQNPLTINANAAVSGTGVTFYLTNGATLKMNGNSDVQISAPTSGTYKGMLFIADRSKSAGPFDSPGRSLQP